MFWSPILHIHLNSLPQCRRTTLRWLGYLERIATITLAQGRYIFYAISSIRIHTVHCFMDTSHSLKNIRYLFSLILQTFH